MNNESKKEHTLQFINSMAGMAFDQGMLEGIEIGKYMGYVAAVDSFKSALSDGLRHGSSECGKALESFKRLGIEE
ncbi:hypothetical protein [Marinobacter sp. OP 3.4]|uniref:hypothetical protein n=1 Tax=Marinobacter sp. OP 3.4 TaxID=3076501 RepID=UPI002E1E8FFD